MITRLILYLQMFYMFHRACFYLFQVTYTPLHHQPAWTTDLVAPPAGLVNYGGALPHLRPGFATSTQPFATLPAAPAPRPPATIRGRPLSAGARHRQFRDRPPETNVSTVRYGEEMFVAFEVRVMISDFPPAVTLLVRHQDGHLALFIFEDYRLT